MNRLPSVLVGIVSVVLLLSSCGMLRYTDPFAYCAAVGTIDAPDARYAGPKVPDAVGRGLMNAMQMSADAPFEPFIQRTTWRCMDGKVYGCNFGANIPCLEKANIDRTPGPALKDFCKVNPVSNGIPAAVTGRSTVYQWRCTDGTPAIVKESTQPDTQGFLSMFWYEISK